MNVMKIKPTETDWKSNRPSFHPIEWLKIKKGFKDSVNRGAVVVCPECDREYKRANSWSCHVNRFHPYLLPNSPFKEVLDGIPDDPDHPGFSGRINRLSQVLGVDYSTVGAWVNLGDVWARNLYSIAVIQKQMREGMSWKDISKKCKSDKEYGNIYAAQFVRSDKNGQMEKAKFALYYLMNYFDPADYGSTFIEAHRLLMRERKKKEQDEQDKQDEKSASASSEDSSRDEEGSQAGSTESSASSAGSDSNKEEETDIDAAVGAAPRDERDRTDSPIPGISRWRARRLLFVVERGLGEGKRFLEELRRSLSD